MARSTRRSARRSARSSSTCSPADAAELVQRIRGHMSAAWQPYPWTREHLRRPLPLSSLLACDSPHPFALTPSFTVLANSLSLTHSHSLFTFTSALFVSFYCFFFFWSIAWCCSLLYVWAILCSAVAKLIGFVRCDRAMRVCASRRSGCSKCASWPLLRLLHTHSLT